MTIEENEYELKSGKSLNGPSFCINLQSKGDAETFEHYLKSGNNDTYCSYLIELQDLDKVQQVFNQQRLEVSSNPDELGELIFLIHPNFSSNASLQNIIETGVLDETEFSLSPDDDPRQQRDIISKREVIQNILEFEIHNGADILIPPTLPIRNMHTETDGQFAEELQFQMEINRKSQAILDGGFLPQDVDLMHIYSVEANSLINPEGVLDRSEEILNAFADSNPDVIGIHIWNTNHEYYTEENDSILEIISELNQIFDIPVFLLNVDEFGLVAFLNGALIASIPLTGSPYPRTGGNGWAPGNYYHPAHMWSYPPDQLIEMGDGPELPCYCDACEGKTVERVSNDIDRWRRHRRVHFLHIKDSEVRQLLDVDYDPEKALAFKIGGSRKTELLNYLEH